jgi:adenylyltransferase/sulfurtransferase
MQFDVWRNDWRRITVGHPAADCPACSLRRFDSLHADNREAAAVLCGRHAVQVSPAQPTRLDFAELRNRLAPAGEVRGNDYLLRFRTGDFEMTIFQDARSIIRGTDDISTARSLYAKFIGN